MTEPVPLTSRQTRALDKIARCPGCGAWVMWADIAAYLAAELDPQHCHHSPDTHDHGRSAA